MVFVRLKCLCMSFGLQLQQCRSLEPSKDIISDQSALCDCKGGSRQRRGLEAENNYEAFNFHCAIRIWL